MKLFKYWTRHQQQAQGPRGTVTIRCYGYSNQSIEDALDVARERAEQAAGKWAQGTEPLGNYYDRAIREEIIEEFSDGDNQIAVISRNAYGALVLNSPVAFFADVDIPQQGLGCLLMGIFGRKRPEFDQQLVEKVKQIASEDPALRIRMYRTARGFRLMITSRQIEPNQAESQSLLRALGSDRLYVSLCRSQDCYRARLTPKPWRIDMQQPKTRFPFGSAAVEQQHRQWESEYERRRVDYATCALVGEFGDAEVDPIVEKITRLHDHYAMDRDKPLA